MRKIVINGERFVEDKYYGTVRYTYEILLALDKIVAPGSITVFTPKCELDQSQFQNIKLKKCGIISSKNSFIAALTRVCWKYILFSLYCFFTNSFTVNTTPVWGFCGFDIIAIHDCTPEMYYAKEHYDETINSWWKRLVRNEQKAAKKCKAVLTVSNSAKKDIVNVYHVPEQKVKVVPNAWQHFTRFEEDNRVLAKYNLKKGSYFFSLGSRLPHKNIKWVTYAASKYPHYTFVVTGDHHVTTDTEFEGKNPGNMIFTGYLKDEEIKALMHHCKAFIQPSFYEGFGIPPLEAMSVGADCIVSDIPVFREIYQDSVWYLDPYGYDQIDLEKTMSETKESRELILNKYSWEESAKELLNLLQKCTEKN